MIRPGVLELEVIERPDGGAELVGDNFYCLLMFARARRRHRPTLEKLAEELVCLAASAELKCKPCRTWTRHIPIPGDRPLYRCSACTGVRQWRPSRYTLATWAEQPTGRGAQLAIFLCDGAPLPVRRVRPRTRPTLPAIRPLSTYPTLPGIEVITA